MDIAERIKHFRKSHLKMSQEQFATELGTTRDVISNIEMNRLKNPEQKTPLYKLICEKFHVNEEWLLHGEGEIFENRTESEEIADFLADLLTNEDDTFKRRLITALSRMSESGWDILEKLIDDIVAENEKE